MQKRGSRKDHDAGGRARQVVNQAPRRAARELGTPPRRWEVLPRLHALVVGASRDDAPAAWWGGVDSGREIGAARSVASEVHESQGGSRVPPQHEGIVPRLALMATAMASTCRHGHRRSLEASRCKASSAGQEWRAARPAARRALVVYGRAAPCIVVIRLGAHDMCRGAYRPSPTVPDAPQHQVQEPILPTMCPRPTFDVTAMQGIMAQFMDQMQHGWQSQMCQMHHGIQSHLTSFELSTDMHRRPAAAQATPAL